MILCNIENHDITQISQNKSIPISRECSLYKASDMLHGDNVCEKSDAVK